MATAKSAPAGAGQEANLFDLFYDLASEDVRARTKAASTLTSKALAAQTAFEEAARVASGEQGPKGVASDVQYTLTRLVKGLSSGRAAARPGFATALVEVLQGVSGITTTEVYRLIQDSTRTAGSMKGHEERDAYFGRIFGFLCLHRAGRLSVSSDADAASVGAMPIGRIVGGIVAELSSLAVKKAWLAEVASEALAAIVPSVPQTLYAKYAHGPISNLIGATSSTGGSTPTLASPAHASLVSATAQLYAEGGGAGDKPPYAALLSSAVASGDFLPLRPAALAACHTYPHLHTFWRRVGGAFVAAGVLTPTAWHGVTGSEAAVGEEPTPCPTTPSPAGLEAFGAFWAQCVEAPMLSPDSSHERKATALSLVLLYLPHASPGAVGAMLTAPLLHVVRANARKKTNYLYGLSRLVLKALGGSVVSAQDSALATQVFTALSTRGHAQWDQATRSRVVSLCTHFLDGDTLTGHMYACMGQFLTGSTGSRSAAAGEEDAAESGDSEEEEGAADLGGEGAGADASALSALLALGDEDDELDADLVAGLTKGSDSADTQRLWCVDAVAAALKQLQGVSGASAARHHGLVFLVAAALFRVEGDEGDAAVKAVMDSAGPLPSPALREGGLITPAPLVRGGTATAVARKLFGNVWDTAAAAGAAAAASRAARRKAAASGAGVEEAGEEASASAAASHALIAQCAALHSSWTALDSAGAAPRADAPAGPEAGEAMVLARALSKAATVLDGATPADLTSVLGEGAPSAVGGLVNTTLSYGALLAAVGARSLVDPAAFEPILTDLLTAAKPLLALPLSAAATLAPEAAPKKKGKTPKKSKAKKGASPAAGTWAGIPVAAWAAEEVAGGDTLAVVVVTETLLGLLSNLGGEGDAAGSPVGAALVREAAKLAAAGLTPLLNAGAVEAVVGVLATPLEQLAPAPPKDGSGEEGDSGDESGEESGSDSEDEGESSDEEEEEEEEEEDAASSAGSAASGGASDLDDGGSVGTLPLPTAAEMRAMDAMVGGIIEAKQAGAAAAAATKARRDAALTFQFRASDILEAWAARGAGSPSGALLLMPCLRALRVLSNRVRLSGGAHPSRGIVQRLVAVLRRLTAKGTATVLLGEDPEVAPAPVEEGEEEEDADLTGQELEAGEAAAQGVGPTGAAGAVEECLLMACASPSPDFSSLAGRVAAGFLAALQEDGAMAEGLSAPLGCLLADAVTSYLTHKNTRLVGKVFAPLWSAAPALAAATLPALTAAVGTGANAFRRAEAVAMTVEVLRAAGAAAGPGVVLDVVGVNPAVVGKRLDAALDAAESAEGGPTPTDPADRVTTQASEAVVGEAASALAGLLMTAAGAGHMKQGAGQSAAKLKELIGAAKALLAPGRSPAGAPAVPGAEVKAGVVNALSALYRCATSGKVKNAAQSALARLDARPGKLDLSWFEGLVPAAAASGKKARGSKRARAEGGGVQEKLQAAAAFADLAAEEGDAAEPSKVSKKKARKQ